MEVIGIGLYPGVNKYSLKKKKKKNESILPTAKVDYTSPKLSNLKVLSDMVYRRFLIE